MDRGKDGTDLQVQIVPFSFPSLITSLSPCLICFSSDSAQATARQAYWLHKPVRTNGSGRKSSNTQCRGSGRRTNMKQSTFNIGMWSILLTSLVAVVGL